MTTVEVAIEATDVFTATGLASRLRPRDDLRVVPRAKLTSRGVLVVAVDRLSTRELGYLRALGRKPAVPKVLVTDATLEPDSHPAGDWGVVRALTRAEASAEVLASSVHAAAAGESAALTTLEPMAEHRRDEPSFRSPAADGLSPRETIVLRLMAEGLDTVGIANRLCYSERTVKNVIQELTGRLNLRSRPHAVAYALREGLI
ncbi:helix-turn-helix transcriptional regulator [Prauserella cavernicola]|uniref:Response regulator transcription factor n=1 Tax=Prauserella cavernicola TaxID=2800127 RepID=A0A934V959_9PSEU|nr:LuxR C-terminal-related transcriptional regulator [Prauserella cavernicola]MBK1789384.1 response regulator transcription factor [Prauserella cavernicola]